MEDYTIVPMNQLQTNDFVKQMTTAEDSTVSIKSLVFSLEVDEVALREKLKAITKAVMDTIKNGKPEGKTLYDWLVDGGTSSNLEDWQCEGYITPEARLERLKSTLY